MVFSLFAVGGAYVAGTVSPAVGRKIKSFFKKEETTVVGSLKVDLAKGEAEVKKL